MSDEKEIARWLGDLRKSEEHRTPGFAKLWEAARLRADASPRRRVYYRLGAAAAVLALLAVPTLRWRGRVPPARTASISQWESPTAFLIETPGRQILRTVPRVGGFIDKKALNSEEK